MDWSVRLNTLLFDAWPSIGLWTLKSNRTWIAGLTVHGRESHPLRFLRPWLYSLSPCAAISRCSMEAARSAGLSSAVRDAFETDTANLAALIYLALLAIRNRIASAIGYGQRFPAERMEWNQPGTGPTAMPCNAPPQLVETAVNDVVSACRLGYGVRIGRSDRARNAHGERHKADVRLDSIASSFGSLSAGLTGRRGCRACRPCSGGSRCRVRSGHSTRDPGCP